jgi:pentapeptide repeat protein
MCPSDSTDQGGIEAHRARNDGQGINLCKADLQELDLSYANLPMAYLSEVQLQGANLFQANFEGADLAGGRLIEANLQGADYEPRPKALPDFWTLIKPHNYLETLVFHRSPAALITLREAFKTGGMRRQERQLTYAIEHTKRLQAWNPSWYNPEEEDPRPWLELLAGKSESLFSYVLFELPSGCGMAPGRALWALLGFIPGFALLY